MLKKLFATLALSALLLVGATAGAGPAQAKTYSNTVTITPSESCSTAPWECPSVYFHLHDDAWYQDPIQFKIPVDGSYELFNAAGKRIDSGDIPIKTAGYRSYAYGGTANGVPFPKGKYTLRIKTAYSYTQECDFSPWWSNVPTTCKYENRSDVDDTYTYTFNWNGKKLTANRQTFTASQKLSATTATTYTAKKSASHTATASYTAKEKATYRYKGKSYTATATKTTKKTHRITKQGSYKANKLKRTATATAKATSYHSNADAKKRAGAKATAAAKTLATNNAKAYANGQATSKAKKALTSKVKSAAYAAAKKRITTKVKADTKKYAEAAALKAAKKKAWS